jgi:hypothetical protein
LISSTGIAHIPRGVAWLTSIEPDSSLVTPFPQKTPRR